MLIRHIKIVFIYFIIGVNLLSAQDYPVIGIGLDEGSPSNTIYDIFQDSKGFIWLGTENGLARFNGTNFKTFNSLGAKSMAVTSIQEDGYGTIWMTNFSGQVLYLEDDTLRPLKQWDELGYSGFPLLNVGDTDLFISQTRVAAYRYDIKDQKLTIIDSLSSKEKTEYVSITGSGDVWMRTNDSIFISLTDIHELNFTLPSRLNTFPTVAKLKDRYLISQRYGTSKNIFEIDQSGNVRELTGFNSIDVQNKRTIKPLSEKTAAFFGLDGALILDSAHRYQSILTGKNIGSITATEEGGIIAGTLDQGLFIIPNLKSKIFKAAAGKGYHRLVFDAANDQIIVGDLGGNIHFYERQGKLIQSIYADGFIEIQSLYVDEMSQRLIAQGLELQLIGLKQKQLIGELLNNVLTTKDLVKVDSTYYLATSQGLLVTDLTEIKHVFLEDIRTSVIERLSETELIIGSQNGIRILDLETNSLVHDRYAFQASIIDLTSAVKWGQHLFLGTETSGLYMYDQDSLKQKFSVLNGLVSNRIFDIDVNEKWIAIATDNGISLIDQDGFTIQNIDKAHGLQSSEVTDIVIVDDELWVTNHIGLQRFVLPIERNTVSPTLKIDNLLLDGELLSLEEDLMLPHDFNELTITFDVGNSIHSFGNCLIYYRVRGDQKNNTWNKTTLSEATARYLSLASGSYQIEAFAESYDGIRSAVLSFPFIVQTPYWQRLWFTALVYFLSAGFIISLVYLFLRQVNGRKREALIRQNRVQESRIAQLTSIRAQINPHFIFNTLSTVQGLVVQGKGKLAGEILQDFSKLMRNVLDLSSKEMVSLEAEIEILQKYLSIENNRLNGELNYRIDLGADIEPEIIRIPSLLTQPFVENAIRHGLMHKEGEKKLVVSFYMEGENLIIKIMDNGIGREAAARLKSHGSSSFAIDAYKRRIELINDTHDSQIKLTISDLRSQQGRPAGTEVEIKVPLDI